MSFDSSSSSSVIGLASMMVAIAGAGEGLRAWRRSASGERRAMGGVGDRWRVSMRDDSSARGAMPETSSRSACETGPMRPGVDSITSSSSLKTLNAAREDRRGTAGALRSNETDRRGLDGVGAVTWRRFDLVESARGLGADLDVCRAGGVGAARTGRKSTVGLSRLVTG